MFRVKVVCNGQVTSDENNEFKSAWRALEETVEGCPPYDEEYSARDVGVVSGVYSVVFKDGTTVSVSEVR
jgi:hypothetical protein